MAQVSPELPNQDERLKNRRILMLMTAIIVIPFLIAYTMFRTGMWMPSGTTNQGNLILPPLQIDDIGLEDASGSPVNHQFSGGLWTLLIVGAGECDARCEEALYLSRQVHIALGKEANRVVRYFAATRPPLQEDFTRRLAVEHPRLISLRADEETFSGYLDAASGERRLNFGMEEVISDSYVFVVDPLGNIMMYYTPEHTGKQMLKDLKKLLKSSKIG